MCTFFLPPLSLNAALSPGRIHLLRNKKKRFKEKALEKVRKEKTFQNKLVVLIKMRFEFTFVLKLSCQKSYFNTPGTEARGAGGARYLA